MASPSSEVRNKSLIQCFIWARCCGSCQKVVETINTECTQQVSGAASAELVGLRAAPALALKLAFFNAQRHLNLETERQIEI